MLLCVIGANEYMLLDVEKCKSVIQLLKLIHKAQYNQMGYSRFKSVLDEKSCKGL